MITLSEKCREVYERAAKDLGPELSGYSIIDLLADNLPGHLDDFSAAISAQRCYNCKWYTIKHKTKDGFIGKCDEKDPIGRTDHFAAKTCLYYLNFQDYKKD